MTTILQQSKPSVQKTSSALLIGSQTAKTRALPSGRELRFSRNLWSSARNNPRERTKARWHEAQIPMAAFNRANTRADPLWLSGAAPSSPPQHPLQREEKRTTFFKVEE
uniref:Uncharacterized protein n=1 Tax=Knipowitschia caucasica TaxID=637954 RepID=A0AAV2LPP8_KNICA